MSAISITEIKSPTDILKFIKFPMDLYKENPNYVPSLFKDEKEIWDREKNPIYKHAEAKLYLAFKDNKIVGRIAVMINHKETEVLAEKKVRFGWLDFIDDEEVSRLLIDQAIQFAKENKVNLIEGPMGFTNLDKSGMLTEGFEELATMIGLYNFSYYPEHLKKLGMKDGKIWVEFSMRFPEVLPEKIIKFSKLISEKYKLKVLDFKSKKEIVPHVDAMFKLLDETYRTLSTYTPISPEQIKIYKEKYFPFISKDYVICIADEHDELVAFAITMPSYSKALQKSKGKLFPFGWWHFLQAEKKNDRANFYLIGIKPEFQRRGVTAIIMKEIFHRFHKMGIKFAETNPELEDNKSVQLLWQDYNPVQHKKRQTFVLEV
ncbi:GNAT family N-acetyltransferase [Frigoriflavimonas asaccharolytica]|uniref:GNAT superfamily N-acetyltransferase n=1 Tax=Frigoriflavimonas asaccharolytica TaxID=2735899 RepID=A0A8J8KBD1_9FLAO|nr:GNAT family N-acetyltransferase [Frigoriflavimonas asaccharolytica]NRS92449.1 GNAT superfamily N-acetyltransferase [Frigoriflavimonas asaccharolytica]